MIEKYISSAKDGNIAYHVNDEKINVDNNRIKLAKKYNYNNNDLKYMNQIHGNKVVIVNKQSPNLTDNCDALVTNEINLPLMVMVADCIPIFLKDEKKGVFAVVHAGRNSTFLKIVQKTLDLMKDKFDCNMKDIYAYLGPSIQKCCYEVSSELEQVVKKSFGEEFSKNRYIDLQGINLKQLKEYNVSNIEISNICTKCSKEPFFSYRKDKNTGRFALIGIRKSY